MNSYYSSPPFLPHVSNPFADINPVSENYGIESKRDGVTETVQWDKVGNYPSYTVGEIMDYLTLIALR